MAVRRRRIVRLSRSSIGAGEALATARIIRRGFLGMGGETKRFEEELAVFLGFRAVCVVNGTSAIQLALQALGVGPGDEVLVPSLTYVATFQAVSATGARPVACDIDPHTLNISYIDAQKRITKNTKAIVPVHISGEFSGRRELKVFSSVHNLMVVEDCAHAFGSLDSDFKPPEPIHLMTYSFDGIKNITSGEGGCVVGADPVLLDIISDLRLLGVKGDSNKRYQGLRSWDFEVEHQGWRAHMNDLMSAIGRVQLRKVKKLAKKRKLLARTYDRLLSDVPVLRFERDYSRTVPHIYQVLLPENSKREAIRLTMDSEGIQTGVHYKPNNRLSFFSSPDFLPVTEALYPRLLSLPLHPKLTRLDQRRVVSVLRESVRRDAHHA